MDLTGGMQKIEQPVSGGHYAQAVVAAGSLTGPTAVATGTRTRPKVLASGRNRCSGL